jgi:L-lactate dehydrogenase complex protein LldG
MSETAGKNDREAILGAIRRSLGRGAEDGAAAKAAERLSQPPRGPLPARATIAHAAQVDLFARMAAETSAKVVRLASMDEVPQAVSDLLKADNLPAEVRLAPDPELEALAWDGQPVLTVTSGPARPEDPVSVTGAFAGVAETGTLVLCSGPAGPTGLNFLPETHMVVVRTSRITGHYEEAWDRLRLARGSEGLPRTVNMITGPSRTADIEQTIEMGAHGPRRLSILLVDDGGPQD